MADVSFDSKTPWETFLRLIQDGRAARPALPTPTQPPPHRTIFISDTHLGTRGCKAEALADFLAHNDCETLFLVGDIVDGWQLKRRWYWTKRRAGGGEILRKVDAGTRVIFVPGNHDEFARDYAGACSAASKSSTRPCMRPPMASACWCCMATASTA